MAQNSNPPEKFTTRLEVTNVPVSTKKTLEQIAFKKGMTVAAYVKTIIQRDPDVMAYEGKIKAS